MIESARSGTAFNRNHLDLKPRTNAERCALDVAIRKRDKNMFGLESTSKRSFQLKANDEFPVLRGSSGAGTRTRVWGNFGTVGGACTVLLVLFV